MPKKEYGKLEHHIIKIFKNEGSFYFNGDLYNVSTVVKPTVTSGGECKTDVYISGDSNSGKSITIKLSVKKKSNNEFQENKVSAKRAEKYFGPDWSKIIQKSCQSIKQAFYDQPLVFGSGKHPIKPNSITLGWKLEIASKERNLSSKLQLSDEKIRNYIYKGTNLDESKRDALIEGVIVPNSGIADYIIYTEIADIKKTADVIDGMQLIDSLPIKPTYLIFTGNNLRIDKDKTDGARPLAVRVEWKLSGGKLDREIIFDNPLIYTGKEWKQSVYKVLKKLRIEVPSKMKKNNFVDGNLFVP